MTPPNAEAVLARALKRWEGEGGALSPRSQKREVSAPTNQPKDALREANDVGVATPAEIIAALQELLAAERAGARVAALTVHEVEEEILKSLLVVIRRDEVRWCAMLIASLQRLGAAPSTEVGAFAEKAMAIADSRARLVFLNKGQAWVVRRLEHLMPRVQVARLRDDLARMHRAHVENIRQVEHALSMRSEDDV